MDTLVQMINQGAIRYKDTYPRLIIALISAQLLVTFVEHECWLVLLRDPYYYLAMVLATAALWGALSIIRKVNLYLDKHCNWFRDPLKRLCWQLPLGLLLPAILPVAAIAVALHFAGHDAFATPYFKLLLKVAVMLLLLYNAYYLCHFFFTGVPLRLQIDNQKKNVQEMASKEACHAELKAVARHSLSELLPPDWELQQVAMIRSESRSLCIYHIDGRKMPWTLPIKHTITLLPKADFFQISKSCIVQRNNIRRKRGKPSDNRILYLLLKVPAEMRVDVARDRRKAFLKWY